MTEEAPKFSMLKKADISLYEIYVEWHYGLAGNPSIEKLNNDGSRWRTRTSADRMFYRKRKAIVDFTTWAIRHLKVLYGIPDNVETLFKNRITSNTTANKDTSSKKKKESKDKKKIIKRRENDDDIQDDFYFKVMISPEWEQIVLGNMPLPMKNDINTFFSAVSLNNYNSKKKPLSEYSSNVDLNVAKATLGALNDNVENNLIKQILHYLDNTIQNINISWARIANYLLTMKMKFRKSEESNDFSFYEDSLINETSKNSSFQQQGSLIPFQTLNNNNNGIDILPNVGSDIDLFGQFGDISTCLNSENSDTLVHSISNINTPELSPWNMSSISDPGDYLPAGKRKFSDGTTITEPVTSELQNIFSLKEMENQGVYNPRKAMKKNRTSRPNRVKSLEGETPHRGGAMELLVSASIAKEIEELAEIKSTLTNIVYRISEIEKKSDFRRLAMKSYPQEKGNLNSSPSSISAETLPLLTIPKQI